MFRVVLADTNTASRASQCDWLRQAGCEVTEASDAAAVLALVAGQPFELALLAWPLGPQPLHELLPQLHRLSPALQVILTAADPTPEALNQALQAGACDCLARPIARFDLLRALAAADRNRAFAADHARLIELERRHRESCELAIAARTRDLQVSEARYRQLVEHNPDGIAIVADSRILFANNSLVTMLGSTPEQLLGRDLLDLVQPDYREAARRGTELALSSGQPQPTRREAWRAAAGELRVEVACLPFTQNGRPALQFVIRDLTQQLRLEDELRQAQKVEAIGQLAGGVAHDFNNLLTVILGHAQLLRGSLPPGRGEAGLTAIIDAAEHAAAVTRQLLVFSRRSPVTLAPVDLSAEIHNMVRMLQRLVGEDIELVVDLAPEAGRVLWDAGQFQQVLMNLIVNARDAMPRGGTVTIRTRPLPAAAASPDNWLELRVSDTGCGIPPQVLPHIFEPFFTTKEAGRGTGLGLATVRRATAQAGGRIDVESQAGQGTTFILALPLCRDGQEAAPALAPRETGQGTETILVVEDDPVLRSIVAEVLRTGGYTTLAASQGAEALQVAGEHPERIHLLLTDIIMPVMNGVELAAKLHAARPDTQVLFMSGYADSRSQSLLDDSRFAANYLQKPFSAGTLLQRVREILTGKPGKPLAVPPGR